MKYTDNVKGLKKTTEGYYDAESHLLFTKDKNGLQIVISEYDFDLFKKQKRRLKQLEKNYNVSLKNEINELTKAFNEYKEYAKKFNNREIKWSNTVATRYRSFEHITLKHEKLFGNINLSKQAKQQFISLINTKKKTMLLRMSGHKRVWDENADKLYNDFLQQFVDKLGIPKEEVEQLLFPNGLEESSRYDDIVDVLEHGYYTMTDVIDEKISEGVITEYEGVALENIMDTGMGYLFE